MSRKFLFVSLDALISDIAWRVQTMVDFLFGKPIRVLSTAEDEQTRERVEGALDLAREGADTVVAWVRSFQGHTYNVYRLGRVICSGAQC